MKKKYSLRIQLIAFLLVFVVAVLGFIYLFQTTFLDSFYKTNKIKTLHTVGREVSYAIGEYDMDTILEEVGMSNEVCVRVVSNNEKYNYTGACQLRNLDYSLINKIASETYEEVDKEKMYNDFKFKRPFGPAPEDMYIFSKMINYDNNDILILVSSGITPLNVTISTIKSQYFIIALVVIIMTLLLAFILSRFILRPIKEINKESKFLSKGEYKGKSVNTSSKELDELNNTLVDANKDILKADKAKKELLGNVSHDLRTPLTMIVGYGEMMRDLPEENNEENINTIIDEAKRLSVLVDDLVDISKMEDNVVELHREDINLNSLLESVYHQYEKHCKANNIDFKLQLSDDVMVNIDENRIKQVLYNFLNNSINYNDKENKEIILGSEKIDNKYRVFVYDNGEGIEEKDIDNIWDRYYKVDKEHKRHQLGSGIGLSLSRQLLIAHDINYGVESKVGEYSKFYFDLNSL